MAPGNSDAIAEAISDLLSNAERAILLGVAGRRRAPLYSTREMLESVEKPYRGVANVRL